MSSSKPWRVDAIVVEADTKEQRIELTISTPKGLLPFLLTVADGRELAALLDIALGEFGPPPAVGG